MKTTTITCDHCGNEIGEENPQRKRDEDLCKKCYEEASGVDGSGSRLDEQLMERWKRGGLALTSEGVVDIRHTAGVYFEGEGKYAVAVLTMKPLSGLHVNTQIGPYVLISRVGQEDEHGKSGFDIYRDGKLVSIIRWRKKEKTPDVWAWNNAWTFSKDSPGVFLWNQPDGSRIIDTCEIVQLAIDDLERHYNDWIDNLKA